MAKNVVIVRNSMSGYGDGWIWAVQVLDPHSADHGKTIVYRTSEKSTGLFRCGSQQGNWARNYDDEQIYGTAEFGLPTDDYARARRIVKRMMERLYK